MIDLRPFEVKTAATIVRVKEGRYVPPAGR